MRMQIKVDKITFEKDLYPRFEEDKRTIDQYRASLDKLPPITVARDNNVLVDGFHRWQAHIQEGKNTIAADNLGNLSDIEILREAIKRNSTHGKQLSTAEKRDMAGKLWKSMVNIPIAERKQEIATIIAVTPRSVSNYLQETISSERESMKKEVWRLWMDCYTQDEIATLLGLSQQTVSDWINETVPDYTENGKLSKIGKAIAEKQFQIYNLWHIPETEKRW